MFDLKPASRPNWLWRSAPSLIVIAAVLLFLAGEVLDRRWEESLRQARCTVVAAKTEGRIRTYTEDDDSKTKAEYVEETTMEFQVDGAGPQRTVRQLDEGRGFQVGQVRDCSVAGERVYLYPEVERLRRRWSTISWSTVVALSGLVWLWRRRSELAR